MSYQKYQTKPLDCWQREKELRTNYLRDLYQAREKGKLIVYANAETMFSVFSGFDKYCEFFYPIAYVTSLISNPELSIRCLEALEVRGYGNTCLHVALPFGSMLINRGPLGEAVIPDICMTVHICEPMSKVSQIISQYYGIPGFTIDFPMVPPEHRRGFHHQYLVSQMHDAIEWMEKITGRECDDECLIEGVRNEWETCVLWAKISELNKAVPAPLGWKSMMALSFSAGAERWKRQSVEFYRMLFDELKERVQNNVAAFATERCRLFHEGAPPWHFMRMFRMAEEYGAVFLGGDTMFEFPGAFSATEDGSLMASKGLEEQGIELRTREDALAALADLHLFNSVAADTFTLLPRARRKVKAACDWHADGVVFHHDNGCQGMPAGMPEAVLALKERGIPTMVYESSCLDRRKFAEAQVVDLFKAFFESLGLTRLKD